MNYFKLTENRNVNKNSEVTFDWIPKAYLLKTSMEQGTRLTPQIYFLRK